MISFWKPDSYWSKMVPTDNIFDNSYTSLAPLTLLRYLLNAPNRVVHNYFLEMANPK